MQVLSTSNKKLRHYVSQIYFREQKIFKTNVSNLFLITKPPLEFWFLVLRINKGYFVVKKLA